MGDVKAPGAPRLRRLWLGLGWLLIGAIWYLSLTPSPPDMGPGFDDKGGHLLAYFVLMAWFIQVYPAPRTQARLALAFIGMGVLIEGLQWLGGARFLEAADMAANSLGVLGAWALGRTPFARALYGLETRLWAR